MNNEAISRHFTMTAAFFVKKNVIVIITDDPSYVGFTSKETTLNGTPFSRIVLSAATDLFSKFPNGKPIPPEMRVLYMYGVLGHECLHQIYTPFDYEEKVAEKIAAEKRDHFYSICNVVEDPAIESAADIIYGGPLLKALDEAIKLTYDLSPEIDKDVPPNDDAYAFTQIMNAFIQLGDRGPVKGHFVSKTAEDYFKKSLPVFEDAVKERDGKKRIDKCVELYSILSPLLDIQPKGKTNGETGKPQGSGDGEALPERPSNGQESESDSGEKSSGSQGESSKKSGEKSSGQKSTGNTSDAGNVKSSSSGSKSDKEAQEAVEQAVKQLKSEIDEQQKKVDTEKKQEEACQLKQAGDYPASTREATTVKITSADVADVIAYNMIVEGNDARIKSLYRNLQRVFKGDTGGKLNSEHGSRINVKRMSDAVLHTKVMVSRKAPKDISEMSATLLIDNSGSMSGTRISKAVECAVCIYEAFDMLNVPMTTFGFNTDWNGSHGVHHIATTFHSPKADRYKIMKLFAKDANFDYFAIDTAREMIKKSGKKHNLLIVISDGAPCSCGSLNVNNGNTATKEAVKKCREEGIAVAGIAIQPHNKDQYAMMYGKDYVAVNETNDLFVSMASVIKANIKGWL